MKIRSITLLTDPSYPLQEAVLRRAGEFISEAQSSYEHAGFEVQTARLATPPFPGSLGRANIERLAEFAQELEAAASLLGVAYVSLGPAIPDHLSDYDLIPDALAATQNVFFSGMMTTPQGGVCLPAISRCAEIIHRAARLSADGFTNLRFAALANVGPGCPFFPAAYHDGASPAFALATEAADLAVEAFAAANSLEEARSKLGAAIEGYAQQLCQVGDRLAERLGIRFGGVDFSLAPFPNQQTSIGEAIERLGVPAAGMHGSLAAAAILADTLDRAHYNRTGFSGLFLPCLEDAVLAARAAEGFLTVKDLLLYSAVCGTGLDTIPLPGETTPEEMQAVLVDLAALAQRLGKPLTARLMPIPGKKAGEPTGFDFAFFANSRILALAAQPLERFLAGGETFYLHPR